VTRGFQQKEGIDYEDIFSLVVRWSPIMIIFALAAKYGWDIRQMDVINTFLDSHIDETILMKISKGFF